MSNNKRKFKTNKTNDGFTDLATIFGDTSVQLAKGSRDDKRGGTSQHRTADIPKFSEARDPKQEDKRALNDYMSALSEAVSRMRTTFDSSNTGVNFTVVEQQLNRMLSDIADTIFNAQYKFFQQVAKSKSDFYTDEFKRNSKEFSESIKSSTRDRGAAKSDARAIRLMFTSMNNLMLYKPFTKINFELIDTFNDVVNLIDEYTFNKFFEPWSCSADNINSQVSNPDDVRGESDVNLYYWLSFLHITPYFKELLKVRGVSDAMISLLGNYAVLRPSTIDEDNNFTSTTFTDVTDSMFGGDDLGMKRYGGPSYAKEVQLDLLKFIDNFKLKASKIIANVTNADTGVAENLFNADLAVKLWMHGAANAVFKVLVEDGMGAMDRVAASLNRDLKDSRPAFIPDVVCLLGSTNKYFVEKAIESAEDFISKGNFYITPSVYKFLKERFGPSITTIKSTVKRFIDSTELPSCEYEVRVIPKLVLPFNPYDEYAAWRVTNETVNPAYGLITGKKVDDEGDRSKMFTAIRLPDAYLDSRNKQTFVNLTLYFDNMLSYGLSAIANNKDFNARSHYATSPTSDVRTSANPGNISDVVGPWVSKRPTTGSGNHEDSVIPFDFYSSFVDRYAALGYLSSHIGSYMHPLFCATIDAAFDDKVRSGPANDKHEESSAADAGTPTDAIAQCLMYHTNPVSLRLMSICDYMANAPGFISRESYKRQQLTRFLNGVVDGDKALFLTPSAGVQKPVYSVSAASIGGLKPEHYFRYTVTKDSTGKVYLIDNRTFKAPTLLRNKTAATRSVNRIASYRLTRADDVTGDLKSAENMMVPSDGSIFGYCGIQYDANNTLGDIYGITAIGRKGNTSLTSLTGSAVTFSAADFKHESLPCFIPCFYIDKDGYERYYEGTFTKRVDVQSHAMYAGQAAPTEQAPMYITNTIWNSDYRMDNALNRWSRALSQWNYNNSGETSHAAENVAFEHIVKMIFAPFSTWKINHYDIFLPDGMTADDYVTGGLRCTNLRYSTSMAMDVRREGSVNGKSQLNNGYVDVYTYRNITGLSWLADNWVWSNIPMTDNFKRKLGIYVVGISGEDDYCYCDKPLHGYTVPIKRSALYYDERSLYSKAYLPRHDGRDTDYSEGTLNNP